MRNVKQQLSDTLRAEIFIKLYPFVRNGKRQYILLCMLKVWSLVLSLVTPYLYLLLVNNVMTIRNLKILPWIIIAYISVFLLQTLTVAANKSVYNKFFMKFNISVKKRMLGIFTKLDATKYSEYSAGDLKNRIDSDISVVEKFLNTHTLEYVYAILSAVIIAVVLLFMNPILAFAGFLMVPLSFAFAKFMGKKVKKLQNEQREYIGKYESFLHSSVQNWKDIKANNLEEKQHDIFLEYREKLSKMFVKNQIYWFTNRSFISFKDFFITRMNLYFIGGLLIIAGKTDVGILLAFMNYYSQFFTNITQITDSVLGLRNDAPSIERVLEILGIQISSKEIVKDLDDTIEVRDVCFRYYETQNLCLDHVSFAIAPKEHVAIVGRSGCGKTTLAKLLMGMYEPVSGTVLIGNRDINAIAFECVSGKVGIVLQDPPLFNLSIGENLRFAKRNVTDNEMKEACEKASILEFIDSLPERFDTVIGERGVKLSGGQKQRLSIARAILQDPDIIIFDEATSSLDGENEKAIVSAIRDLSHGKTVITIAHRLSTILGSDRVIVMDEGKIAAIGHHEELRLSNDIYGLLFENQYRE